MSLVQLENVGVGIVDVDLQFSHYLQELLESWGCRVSLAGNGAEGLRLVESARPGRVMTDLPMPTAGDLELIMVIRRIDPRLPLIAKPGAFERRNEACLGVSRKLGANLLLAKPSSL